jgi:hypothetical protein
MKINVVDDEPCPGCGAVWMSPMCDSGHPLDFPNRPKVDNFWKCYNPDCDVAFYCPETGEVELATKPKDRERARCYPG